MRVDNVPPWLKPAFHTFGYGVGGLFWALTQAIRSTCQLEWTSRAPVTGARIECIWHENLPSYFASYLPPRAPLRYAWMNHPIWYMRPIHVLLAWSGVHKLALGSTGHGGQAALERIVGYLRAGYRTTMAVDGPAGPPRQLKRGALDMARASGLPIVAIHFEYERALRSPEWDRKHFPLPGSRVRIRESEPMFVTDESYEQVRQQLAAAL
jgi:lysophospholipid acyltransferase (LPLAT)-like uncharacterized protein